MGILKVCAKPRPRPRPRPKPISGAEEEVFESVVALLAKEGRGADGCFLLGTMTLAVGFAGFIGKWLLVYEM